MKLQICRLAVAGVIWSTLAFATLPTFADEGPTPLVPGISAGLPLGALPPEGWYITYMFYPIEGNVTNNTGSRLPIRVLNWTYSTVVLWSSPHRLLGAQYGASLIQPIASHGTNLTGVGGPNARRIGLFNTIFSPLILSWHVSSSVFISTTQTIYVNDGDYRTANGVRSPTSYANGFWTYEPSAAVSYLHDGVDLTANVAYDLNSGNKSTHYRSGSVGYLDLTAAITRGRFTYGMLADYTKQTENDTVNGVVVGPGGNKAQHTMAGAMFGFTAGRFNVTFRYMQDLRTRNDVDLHIGYISIGTKL